MATIEARVQEVLDQPSSWARNDRAIALHNEILATDPGSDLLYVIQREVFGLHGTAKDQRQRKVPK